MCFDPDPARSPIQQASAFPLRSAVDEADPGQVEICLITSIRRGKWGVPKGIIDSGETAEETALKEAEEEAGLRGDLLGPAVGFYEYRKWGTRIEVAVFAMQVTCAADDWMEADLRERRWVPVETALELISKQELRDLLPAAVDQWRTRYPGSA